MGGPLLTRLHAVSTRTHRGCTPRLALVHDSVNSISFVSARKTNGTREGLPRGREFPVVWWKWRGEGAGRRRRNYGATCRFKLSCQLFGRCPREGPRAVGASSSRRHCGTALLVQRGRHRRHCRYSGATGSYSSCPPHSQECFVETTSNRRRDVGFWTKTTSMWSRIRRFDVDYCLITEERKSCECHERISATVKDHGAWWVGSPVTQPRSTGLPTQPLP